MNKQIEQKKSAVDLTELAIGIVILGVVVSIGAVVLSNVAKTQIVNAATYQVGNETVQATQAGTTLAQVWGQSATTVINASDSTLINAKNYTFTVDPNSGAATLSNASCSGGPGCLGAWKITYQVYNTSDPRYAVANNATIGLAEYGNWFKILVIVGISAVVLALIFMAFGRGGHDGAEGGIAY